MGTSLVAALLASCSALGDASAGGTASVVANAPPTATAQPTAKAQPTAEAQRIPEGVVASGVFNSADGSTTGTVDVVVKGDLAELVLHDLVSTHEPLGVRAPFDEARRRSGHSVADPCLDGDAFGFADIVAGTPTGQLDLPSGWGDPTFISEIALTTSAALGSDAVLKQADGSTDCINKVVARARLVWTFGPRRPYLDTLVDSGTRSGAGGEVAIDATGHPVAYTVAPNDLLPEVAGRFGITPEDAFYLNPARAGSPEAPMLYVSEVLNLNLRAR